MVAFDGADLLPFRSNPSQSIERTFQLIRSDRDLLSKSEYDIQVGCNGDSELFCIFRIYFIASVLICYGIYH